MTRCEQKKNSTGWIREIKREITVHFPRSTTGGVSAGLMTVTASTSTNSNRRLDASKLKEPLAISTAPAAPAAKPSTATVVDQSLHQQLRAFTMSTVANTETRPTIAKSTGVAGVVASPAGTGFSQSHPKDVNSVTNDQSREKELAKRAALARLTLAKQTEDLGGESGPNDRDAEIVTHRGQAPASANAPKRSKSTFVVDNRRSADSLSKPSSPLPQPTTSSKLKDTDADSPV